MIAFEWFLLYLIAAVAVAPLARRLDVPSPVMQVIAGAAMSLFTSESAAAFDPQLVFLIFVPPLLYWGSVTTSLRELTRHRRAIGMLAVGGVLVTIAAVAWVAHAVGGLPWAASCVLGAVVSPPDAAVILAIARRLGIPRHLVAILEGETLFNDVAAFTAYKIAVAAALGGGFTMWSVAPQVALAALGGVAIGSAVAGLHALLRRGVREPVAANALSLLMPFASYLPADWLGASGVLAVVTTGLWSGQLSPSADGAHARLRERHLWEVLLFVLNGLIFLLIGLHLGIIVERLARHPDAGLIALIALVSAVVVGVRILWVVPAAIAPRLVGSLRREHDPLRSWRATGFVAWTGIRGGDTLVTALAVPLVTAGGAPFPGRDTILAVAFGVILVTLVAQGLTLRPLIRLCRFARDPAEAEEEREGRARLAEAGMARLAELAEAEGLPAEALDDVRIHHHLRRRARSGAQHQPETAAGALSGASLLRINREVLRAERRMVVRLRDQRVIGDDVMRRLLREIDLEEVVMDRVLE